MPAVLLATALLWPHPAAAHVEPGTVQDVLSGFRHPIGGRDHLVAMVAVGLWGAQLGAPAVWLLPLAFPLVMALGGVAGVLGMPLPMPDLFIAVSALVLGGVVALGLRAPLAASCVLVAAFAVFHGHSHGIGLRGTENALGYGVGFVVATGLLHGVGIAFGLLNRWPGGAVAVRLAGLAVAAAGVLTLVGTVMAA